MGIGGAAPAEELTAIGVRVSAGRLEDVPRDRCVAVAGGAAVLARTGDGVVAFENRCLHQNSELADGLIHNEILICPMHFWRYRLPAGRHMGSKDRLVGFPTELVDGEVWVDVPEPEYRRMADRSLAGESA